MNDCKIDGHCPHAGVRHGITVSDDYERLLNKPSINGIELVGNKSAKELSLLTNNLDTYKEVKLGTTERGSFLLLTNNEGEVTKLKLNELSVGRFTTTDKIANDMEIGSYVFLLKEANNGTNNK